MTATAEPTRSSGGVPSGGGRYTPPGPTQVSSRLVWIGIAVLVATSLTLFVIAVPRDGPPHISSLLDFVSHYKAGAVTFCLAAVATISMLLDFIRSVISADPYVLCNAVPIGVGFFGVWLALVASKHVPPNHSISDDLDVNRGLFFVSFMVSYFVGGFIHSKQESYKDLRRDSSATIASQ